MVVRAKERLTAAIGSVVDSVPRREYVSKSESSPRQSITGHYLLAMSFSSFVFAGSAYGTTADAC